VRRLQLDSGTAVRAVSGIAVSVAGVIALQGLLSAVQVQYTQETGNSSDQFQAIVLPNLGSSGRWTAALKQTPGVPAVATVAQVEATSTQSGDESASAIVKVGDCAALRQFAELGTCTDGDAFVVAGQNPQRPRPGTTYTFETPGQSGTSGADPARAWTLPGTTRTVAGLQDGQPNVAVATQAGQVILATPAAVRASRPDLSLFTVYAALDPADPEALDRLRNSAARLDPSAYVMPIQIRTVENTLVNIRQVLLAGATALLLLIGASMLVNVVEQLRERRQLLAVLVAFGTRRSTLAGSVLYQVAIPVLLGLSLAVATGTGLAAILQAAADAPIRLDWFGIGATSGAAALVVLLTTAASLPLLWRLTRPAGLRSE
jgi:hypothetical protein